MDSSNTKLQDLEDLNQLAIEENNQKIQEEILENIKALRESVKKMK